MLNTLSPQAALDQYDEIVTGLETLAQLPMLCPLLKTLELSLKGYRALRIKNYMVFFVVQDDTVQTRRILYAKRQYESLL